MIPLSHSERRKPPKQEEPYYAQHLTPCCTYFRLELYLLHLFAVIFPSFFLYVLKLISILNLRPHIQAPSPRDRCGSVIPPSPAPLFFLAAPKLEFEARRSPRNGDVCTVVTEMIYHTIILYIARNVFFYFLLVKANNTFFLADLYFCFAVALKGLECKLAVEQQINTSNALTFPQM